MNSTNMRDGYKFYKDNYENPVDCKTYLEIVCGLMKFMMSKVRDGFDVKMGARLGALGVRGSKIEPVIAENGEIRGIAPSWHKTKEYWKECAQKLGISVEEYVRITPRSEKKVIYCFNEHSNFIKYKMVWYKANVLAKNNTYYGLGFSKYNKRALSALIKDGKEYLVTLKKEKNGQQTERIEG
jgi:hypothetical protein